MHKPGMCSNAEKYMIALSWVKIWFILHIISSERENPLPYLKK